MSTKNLLVLDIPEDQLNDTTLRGYCQVKQLVNECLVHPVNEKSTFKYLKLLSEEIVRSLLLAQP